MLYKKKLVFYVAFSIYFFGVSIWVRSYPDFLGIW